MASLPPSGFDASIPLQVKGPLDQLGGVGGALGLGAKMQLGKLASQSVSPDGQVDYDKFLSLVMQNPLTAGFAGQEISQLRQAQLSQAQLATEQQKQMGTLYGQFSRAALAARDPTTLKTLLSSTIAGSPPYVRQQAGSMLSDLLTGLTSGITVGPDGQLTPQGMATWNARRQALSAMLGANADTRFAAFGSPSDVQQGWGTEAEAAKPVTGPVTPGGAPTVVPARAYAGGNVLAGQPPGNALAPAQPPTTPVRSDLAPGTKETITEQSKAYAEQGPKQYNNAVAMQGRLATMQHDLDTMVSGNPSLFTNPGSGAEARMNLARAYNTFLQSMGADQKYLIDPTKVGNMEELMKEAKLSGFSFMNSMMGAQREAAQIVQAAMKAVPNAENSPIGMQYLINSWKELAQRQIDQRIYETNWLRDPKHDGSLLGADESFNVKYPAEAYAYRAVSNTKDPISGQYVQPYEVKKASDLKKYLSGTYVKYPDGRLVEVPAQYSGYQPITLQQ